MTTTPSTTTCSRGDVFLVRLRFTDDSGFKLRPALVVSVDRFHESRRDALLVPLTSTLGRARFGDYRLIEWRAAGLVRPTVAKGLIETIVREALVRRIGSVSERDLAGVSRALAAILGLSQP